LKYIGESCQLGLIGHQQHGRVVFQKIFYLATHSTYTAPKFSQKVALNVALSLIGLCIKMNLLIGMKILAFELGKLLFNNSIMEIAHLILSPIGYNNLSYKMIETGCLNENNNSDNRYSS